ncbi:MAG TPA: hypothetical protein DCQ32_01130 [Cyanobacteria bacterium UBA8156]|nr:hypothetical protein [Cyanobacteria bacterium UBA8156]
MLGAIGATLLGTLPVAAQSRTPQIFRSNPNSFPASSPVNPNFGNTFSNLVLPAGQKLVTRLAEGGTLYISTGETRQAVLQVDRDVVAANGVVLIPTGATIAGDFVPVAGGCRFVARTLNSRGTTVRLAAESDPILDVKDPRETGTGAILGDAAIGAAGAAILGAITGDRTVATEELLAGAAASVIIGNTTAPQAVVIEPNKSVELTLRQDLRFQ